MFVKNASNCFSVLNMTGLLKFVLQIVIGTVASIYFINANASSCSFKTQIRYTDGSIGCIEDLPNAQETPIGQSDSLLFLVRHSKVYFLAKSKDPKCKGIFFASSSSSFTGSNAANIVTRSAVMDQCLRQGCECEVVLADGVAEVDKATLFGPQVVQSTKPSKDNPSVKDTIAIAEEVGAAKIQQEAKAKAQQEAVALKAKQEAEAKALQEAAALQAQPVSPRPVVKPAPAVIKSILDL